MAKKKTKFVCQECGYESPKWMGKCPVWEWNKMVEEVEAILKQATEALSLTGCTIVCKTAIQLRQLKTIKEPRITTTMAELNRVLRRWDCSRFTCFNWWRSWNREINAIITSVSATSRTESMFSIFLGKNQ